MGLVYLAKLTGLNRYIPIAVRAAKRNGLWPDRENYFRYIPNHGYVQDMEKPEETVCAIQTFVKTYSLDKSV